MEDQPTREQRQADMELAEACIELLRRLREGELSHLPNWLLSDLYEAVHETAEAP